MGSIAIFIREGIEVAAMINTPFTEVVESLFLLLKIGKFSVAVGEIYRIPNTDLKIFADLYSQILSTLSNQKNVIIGSDHNLDFLKLDKHPETAKFYEKFY